jgi:hypothetical protein
MKTRADLLRMVLRLLTIIDPTENPDAEQTATADPYIDGARGLLLEKGLCWWDADAIPDAVILPLHRYVAAQACGAFGRAGKGFEAGEAAGLKELRSLKNGADRETVRTEYF